MPANPLPICVRFAAGTDVGCSRGNNEDSYGYDYASNIYVVCDGMGGMAAGEVASSTAVEAFLASFHPLAGEEANKPLQLRVLDSIQAANRAVRDVAAGNGESNGESREMGTTLVCAAFEGSGIVIGNIGDSRAYFARDGQCMQITQDHSFLAEQVRDGLMTHDEAAQSGMQSVITRALGVSDRIEPDFFGAEVVEGDVVLLTTDGLLRHVSDAEIGAALTSAATEEQICDALIQNARERGGIDNITCIVLRVAANAS